MHSNLQERLYMSRTSKHAHPHLRMIGSKITAWHKKLNKRTDRKEQFLIVTARSEALRRFNSKRAYLGAPPMDFIPLGCPGGWA